jgi:hypothetical protein
MTARLLGLLALATALVFAVPPVHAHSVSSSRLDVRVPDEGAPLQVELDIAIRDLALSVPLDTDRDERVTWGELLDARGSILEMVERGLVLSSAGEPCELEPAGMATRQYDDGAYATLRFEAECTASGALRIDYSIMRDRDPQHRALVTLRRGENAATAIARGKPVVFDVALERASGWDDYLREGVHHILIGYDHVAFLLSLLLPAALLRDDGRWQPVANWRRSVGPVLGIVTAFTAAHSITLSLAALGWVTPASRWVEAAIAASVLLAALNNVKPLVTRRLWLVGFGFGLIHGFGFAGALGELGLPDRARLAALLGFNLGVELGQIAIVAAVMPVLVLVRDRRWYARVAMPVASLLIAAIALHWLWQRLQG